MAAHKSPKTLLKEAEGKIALLTVKLDKAAQLLNIATGARTVVENNITSMEKAFGDEKNANLSLVEHIRERESVHRASQSEIAMLRSQSTINNKEIRYLRETLSRLTLGGVFVADTQRVYLAQAVSTHEGDASAFFAEPLRRETTHGVSREEIVRNIAREEVLRGAHGIEPRHKY